MAKYKCDDCDHECKVEMADNAPYPDSCVLTGGACEWIKHIIISQPSIGSQLARMENKGETL